MPNSVDLFIGIFLHVIPVCIIFPRLKSIEISGLKSKYFDIPDRVKSFSFELQRKPPIFLRIFLARAFIA